MNLVLMHNMAIAQCRYSLLNGDEHGSWFDAQLTELGIEQARTANGAWKTQIANGIPPPQSYYVSPLMRCCETARVTFDGTKLPGTEPFRPLVKEV